MVGNAQTPGRRTRDAWCVSSMCVERIVRTIATESLSHGYMPGCVLQCRPLSHGYMPGCGRSVAMRASTCDRPPSAVYLDE